MASSLRAISERHPRLAAAYGWATKHPILASLLLVLARSPIDAVGYVNLDTALFAAAGRSLVFEGNLDVFSDARVQVGPLHLIYDGVLARLAGVLGVDVQVPIVIASELLFTAVAVLCFRRLLAVRGRSSPDTELFVGCVMALAGPAWVVGTSSHPAEGLVPLAWVVSVLYLRSGNEWKGGGVLGLAASFKLWALLGGPLVLLACRPRKIAGASLAFVGVTALFYAPFLLWGEVNTFDFEWTIKAQSPLAFIWDVGMPIGWTQRVIQGVAVAAVGAGLALLFRRRVDLDWGLPLALVTTRLLFDPTDFHYYWVAAGVLGILGASLYLPSFLSARHGVIAAGFYLTLFPFFLTRGLAQRVYLLVLLVSVLTAVCLRLAHGSDEEGAIALPGGVSAR